MGKESKQYNTREAFLELISDLYLMQMKRENFYNDGSYINLYNWIILNINDKIEKDPERAEEYEQMYEITNRFYEIVTNPETRDMIISKKMKKEEFIRMYQEQILGDDKRTYDMTGLFDERLINSSKDGTRRRMVRYVQRVGQENRFKRENGKEVIIQQLGSLEFVESTLVQNNVTKYRVMRQIAENDYRIDEVYSNIQIINMEDPEYREAVLEELLSQNNIQFSNTDGYVGDITNIKNVKNDLPVGEETVISGHYLYRINDNYAIEYSSSDLTAVMLYEEQKKRMEKSRKELETIDLKPRKDDDDARG